jgi:hypothetical protein
MPLLSIRLLALSVSTKKKQFAFPECPVAKWRLVGRFPFDGNSVNLA